MPLAPLANSLTRRRQVISGEEAGHPADRTQCLPRSLPASDVAAAAVVSPEKRMMQRRQFPSHKEAAAALKKKRDGGENSKKKFVA